MTTSENDSCPRNHIVDNGCVVPEEFAMIAQWRVEVTAIACKTTQLSLSLSLHSTNILNSLHSKETTVQLETFEARGSM